MNNSIYSKSGTGNQTIENTEKQIFINIEMNLIFLDDQEKMSMLFSEHSLLI
jgi:hypothetical protein